ncbi:MAG: GHKL domain-containing protein [bacterium]|nr:GHKL domain-containing protein [bacterium]
MRRRSSHSQPLFWGISLLLLATAPGASGRTPVGLASDVALDQLTIVHWTTEDGLPSNALTNVVQTRDGYIWIASFSGLIRFDGVSFTTFDENSQPALPAGGIYELVEDADGTLWIGTQGGGVLTYRDGRFRVFHGEYGQRSTVHSLLIGERGELWVGVTDFGVYQHRDGKLIHLEHSSLTDSTVRDILRDREGALWFAAEGRGLVRFHEGSFRAYSTRSGLASVAVTSLYESPGGELYVGSWGGLNKLADGEITSVAELAGTEVYRVYGDDVGNLWLVTDQGLYRRNAGSGRFERLVEYRGQELRGVAALTFDHEGSLWLATTTNGLFQLKKGKFRNYSPEQGLSSSRINVVRELGPGEYWAGTDNGTINVIREGGEVSTLELASLRSSVRVRDIHRDRHGDLWITSYAGLLHLSGSGEVLYSTHNGLPTNQLRELFEDRRGKLWIGTQNSGLVGMPEPGRFETFDKSSGLISNFVFSVDEDLEGRLVIGTRGALTLLDAAGRFTHYTAEQGLPGNIVFSTSTDPDGSLWISTNGGLARLVDGEIRTVTARDGLGVRTVFDFAEDDRGFVWLSSSQGVLRIAKAQLVDFLEGRAQRLEATLLDEHDGMISRGCTGASHFLEASDGKLWFPTLGGIAVVDPMNLEVNEIAPRVAINRFQVDGEPVLAHQDLDFDPGKKRFAFELAALSFLAPEKVRIRYRLEDFDDDWIDAGAERSAHYTNLPSGEYALRVIAANNDGVWNHEGATLHFRLRPFYYQRPGFYAVLVVLVALAVRALHRRRLGSVRKRNLELERIVAELERSQSERLRLIRQLESAAAEMERFVFTVSHDLKSPLVSIKGFLGYLRSDMAAGEFERAELDAKQIDTAADKMRHLVGELLDLSRVKREVNAPTEAAISELAGEAAELVSGPISERGVELLIEPDMPVVLVDRERLVRVFQNLIENAVKFLGDERAPLIEVGCRRDASTPIFFVRDNGRGIESGDLEKVFEMFERLHGGEGTGLGLAIVERIIEAHSGRIWAESEGRGRGATFCFTLGLTQKRL